VLAESWSKGWRAYCTDRDGEETDLGEPEPMDGFATGWKAAASCTTARFAFAPQRMASVAYLLSLIAAVLMVVFLLVTVVRRSEPVAALRRPALIPEGDTLVRLGWGWAIAAGVAAGLAGGLLFAIRAGAVLLPLTVVALRVGVSVKRLLVAAAVCIAALPLIYLVFPARDRGGNDFGYPSDLVGAHWVALLAVLCLLAAGLLLAARLRAASASGSRSSTSAPRERQGSAR
jgi:arabinofuranan 3-O-arabinosyltransferase